MANAYTELVRHSGNQNLFRAIEMSVLASEVSRPLHFHAEGIRGTGKTTIIKAARAILPPIERIYNCRYNCHPLYPHCFEHYWLDQDEVAAIGVEQIPMPFIEISHTDRVLPDIILQAHRGIIFINEINRLADKLPDLTELLLAVMEDGHVQIQSTGLPLMQVPVQVSVWAASNLQEQPGALEQVCRRLADSFDLVVRMGNPVETDVVQYVLEQSQSFRANPRRIVNFDPLAEKWQQQQRFQGLGAKFEQVRMSEEIKNIIASIYLGFGMTNLRIVESMELSCRAYAALQNRNKVIIDDLTAIVPLVLAHRVEVARLSKILNFLDCAHFVHSVPTLPPTL